MAELRVLQRLGRSVGGLVLSTAVLVQVAPTAIAQASGAIAISGTMEGNLIAEPGDILDGGYDFTIPGTHQVATVSFPGAKLTFHYSCSGGAATGSFTLGLASGPWNTSMQTNGWTPSGYNYGAWEGSMHTPDLCSGGAIHLNQGATFTAGVDSSMSNTINVRFHYRDSGTIDCAVPAPAGNTVNTQPCSASWSGTASVVPVPLQSLTGRLFYTEYVQEISTGSDPGDNIRSVPFTYDGSTFTLGATAGITETAGADGIALAPNGDLLVGGQNTGFLYEVDPSNGATSAAIVPSGSAFHVTVDPSGQVAWTAGLPGPLSEVPLNPLGQATTVTLAGDDTAITGIAFAGTQAFYTASGPQGTGSFGTIDMSTLTTHRVFSDLPDAHGLTYDPFTKDLLMVGASTLTQIDPSTLTVVAQRTFTLPGTGATDTLDQVNTDGAGHIFIAANDGILIFEDDSSTGRVDAAANFVSSQFLDNALDDVVVRT